MSGNNINNGNNARIFKFITDANKNLMDADLNGDGILTRKEVTKFLEGIVDLSQLDLTDVSKDKDVFNIFFDGINTLDSSKGKIRINGKKTRFRESNTLNANEIAIAENKIAAEAALDEYLNGLSDIPSEVKADVVKDEMRQILEQLMQKELFKGAKCSKEEFTKKIQEFLTNNGPRVKNQAIAKSYASDYSMEFLNDYVKNYGYKIGDDKTLQEALDKFLETVDGTMTFNEIKNGIEGVVKNYAKTAEVTGEKGEPAPLNDLQKAVAMKKLTEVLVGVAKYNTSAPYEENKTEYDAAIKKFLEAQLSGNVDFQAILTNDSIRIAFQNELNAIESDIIAKNAFKNEDILNMIAADTDLGSDMVQMIKNLMPGEVKAFDKLKDEIAGLVKKGDFLLSNGKLDVDTLGKWIVEQLKSILADFYGDMSSDMSRDDLIKIYEAEIDAANKNSDSNAIKKAAKSFLKAISEKATEYKAAVEDTFGADFEAKIDKMYAYEIRNKMTTLINSIKALTVKVDVQVTDQSAEILNELGADYGSIPSSTLSFYINDKGEIKFVTMKNDIHGVFNRGNTENGDLKSKIEGLQTQLKLTYGKELKELGLVDDKGNITKDGNALFNAALFLALSDPTIVTSQYEKTTDITKLIEAVVKNYTKLLQRVAKDENAMQYIKNYTSNSILAGRNPSPQGDYSYHEMVGNLGVYERSDCQRGIQRYYADGSTYGGDDWIKPSTYSGSRATHKHNGQTISIIEYTTSETVAKGDVDALNKGLRTLADDYVDKYGSMISADRICELFRQAQEEAMRKIDQITSCTQAAGSNVYGYGENGDGANWDNFDTASSCESGMLVNIGNVILQVMFEMERLIGLEIMNG